MKIATLLLAILPLTAPHQAQGQDQTASQEQEAHRLIAAAKDGQIYYSSRLKIATKSANLLNQYIGIKLLGGHFKQYQQANELSGKSQSPSLPFDHVVSVLYEHTRPVETPHPDTTRAAQSRSLAEINKLHEIWMAFEWQRQRMIHMGLFLKQSKHFPDFKAWASDIIAREPPEITPKPNDQWTKQSALLSQVLRSAAEQWTAKQWWLRSRHQTMDKGSPIINQPLSIRLPHHVRHYMRKKNMHRSFDMKIDGRSPSYRTGKRVLEYRPDRHAHRPGTIQPAPKSTKLKGQ